MLINKANISMIFINLKTTFNTAFQAAPSQWNQTAMLVPSGSSQNDYNWLSSFPRMRKWIGEKVVKSLAAFKYSIVNDDWEATVEVNRNHIEDDQLGIYVPQAQMAGFSARQLPDEIVSDLKNNAFARRFIGCMTAVHQTTLPQLKNDPPGLRRYSPRRLILGWLVSRYSNSNKRD